MPNSSEKLENLLGGLPFLDSRPYASMLAAEYGLLDVALSITPANILLALQRARQAREFAVSYRDFNVGAALFAFQFSPARGQLVTGVNIKPEEGSSVNIHAEQSALRKVANAGFNAVSIIAVVGETQADQQSGHEMCTLHPCGLCRQVLKESPLIDNDGTLIITARPDLRTVEFSTVNKLGLYHDEERFDEIVRIDVPDLELLTPFEPTGPVRLDDSEEMIREDHIWHDLISPHLLPFKASLFKSAGGSDA